MQALIIAVFVVMYVHDGMGEVPPAASFPVLGLLVVGPMVGLGLAFQIVAWLMGRRLDRRGQYMAVVTAERAMLLVRVGGCALTGYAILELGWLTAVRLTLGDWVFADELAAIGPLLALFLATWWAMYPIDRRLKEATLWRELQDGTPVHAPPGRGRYVWQQTRHSLLLMLVPLGLVWSWQESLVFTTERWFQKNEAWLGWGWETVRWAGMIAIFLVTPAVLRLVWDTVRIGDGEMREQSLAVCRKFGVRVNGPLLWRTDGAMVNAAILGLLYPFRYMLFTDALLERLSRDQVEGVIAHEVAHVKLRHMVWLAVCIFAAVMGLGWIAWGVDVLFGPLEPEAVEMWGTAPTMAMVLLAFGYVSRRFEWQADAFAVRHLSGESPVVTADAVDSMASALHAVAHLNGMPIRKFTFRHGSIAERQRRILSLAQVSTGAFPIDRQVRVVKIAALVILGASLTMYAWAWVRERADSARMVSCPLIQQNNGWPARSHAGTTSCSPTSPGLSPSRRG